MRNVVICIYFVTCYFKDEALSRIKLCYFGKNYIMIIATGVHGENPFSTAFFFVKMMLSI